MKTKPTLLTIILYIFLFALISSFIFIYYFQKKITPIYITYAEREIRHLTTIVINNSIKKYLDKYSNQNLLEINKDSNKNLTLIHYNTIAINKATNKIAQILQSDLENMTKGNFQKINLKLNTITKEEYEKLNKGLIFTISLGNITGNLLLENLGPKIPLKISLVGEIAANIKTKVKEYGLNNAMIEIYVETKTIESIQMPFLSKEITIKNNIPLTIEIIQGNIPEYYMQNK